MHIERGKLLSSLSTFGIGGPARFYIEAKKPQDAREALQWALSEKLPVFVLGKGSNCLFDDRGYNGLILHNKIDFCDFAEASVSVGSGYSFSLLGVQSARKGLSGLEFASGIPGTVGGAVFMNAGANKQETAQSLFEVLYMNMDGSEIRFLKADLDFSYRSSSFQNMQGCILGARFNLIKKPEARETQLSIVDYRLKTQPYKEKSAGCIFRNPAPDLTAGALIEESGLKGVISGGAKVSEKHANFIVNAAGASSADVLKLIQIIQEKVAEKSGVHLEPEVRKVAFYE